MLVLPFRMDEKTKGGILLGDETIDRQQVASQCGSVLAMGDACYVDKERYPNGPWCKVGDWVPEVTKPILFPLASQIS